eukprot:gene3748-2656_t
MSLFPTFLAPFTKLSRAVKQRGWKGTITQLYVIGDLKFGELKGTDRHGNNYYENVELPYGQHRWVEYSNIHNPDSSQIPPEWHGWMHHTFDEVPSSTVSLDNQYGKTSVVADALYNTHLGKVDNSEHIKYEQHNLSQYRHRGYNVGSLMTEAGEPEPYYKQPGHPLSQNEGGRFQEKKYVTEGNVKTIEFSRRPRVNKK